MVPDAGGGQGSPLKGVLDGAAALFTARPDRARVTASVRCRLVGCTQTLVESGRHRVTTDEPKFAGGTDAGPSPAHLLLVALASCEAVMFRYWSERLEIPFDSLEVDVDANIDLRGALGFDAVRPGYTNVRTTLRVRGTGTADRYEELRRRVEATCPVLDVLRNPLPVTTRIVVG